MTRFESDPRFEDLLRRAWIDNSKNCLAFVLTIGNAEGLQRGQEIVRNPASWIVGQPCLWESFSLDRHSLGTGAR